MVHTVPHLKGLLDGYWDSIEQGHGSTFTSYNSLLKILTYLGFVLTKASRLWLTRAAIGGCNCVGFSRICPETGTGIKPGAGGGGDMEVLGWSSCKFLWVISIFSKARGGVCNLWGWHISLEVSKTLWWLGGVWGLTVLTTWGLLVDLKCNFH